MKKYKFKAAGGASSFGGTPMALIQGGADTANVGSSWLLNKYGYKQQPGKSSYSLIGNSRTRAGSTTGAYTDLSKFTSEPSKYVKSKDWGLLNTMNTISDIGVALTSGSASALEQGLNTDKTKTTPKTAPEPQSLMSDNTLPFQQKVDDQKIATVTPNASLADVGKQMSTNMVSTPDSQNPSQFDSLIMGTGKTSITPFIKDNTPTQKPTTFDSLLGGNTAMNNNLFDTKPQMDTGGKNKKSAVPVEAEGGEMKIQFDDNYNIISKTPIVGASHEKGGVDVKLPKNHAILNSEQIKRLNSGEPLKSILSSLPDVNGATKAWDGTDNDPKKKKYDPNDLSSWGAGASLLNTDTTTDEPYNWKQYKFASRTTFPTPTPPVVTTQDKLTEEMNRWGYGTRPTTGQQLPNPWDEISLENTISGNKPTTPGSAGFAETTIPKDQTGKNLIDTGLDMSPISLEGMTEGQKRSALNNIPGQKPSLMDTGFKPPDNTDPNTPKFGYPEKKALGDVFSNLLALTQPRPKGVTIPITNVGSPSFVTPRFLNPKATLNEVGKQINTGIKTLQQAGKADAIPSLISAGIESTSKIGESFAQINSQADTVAMGENAKASNQFSLTQSGINADVSSRNAMLELERLKAEGLQDTERYRALSNLMYGPADLQRLQDDEKMRSAVRARLLTQMYMGK